MHKINCPICKSFIGYAANPIENVLCPKCGNELKRMNDNVNPDRWYINNGTLNNSEHIVG